MIGNLRMRNLESAPCDYILTMLAATEDVSISAAAGGSITLHCGLHRTEYAYDDAIAWISANGIPDRIQQPRWDR
jgi:hypothetical protein